MGSAGAVHVLGFGILFRKKGRLVMSSVFGVGGKWMCLALLSHEWCCVNTSLADTGATSWHWHLFMCHKQQLATVGMWAGQGGTVTCTQ